MTTDAEWHNAITRRHIAELHDRLHVAETTNRILTHVIYQLASGNTHQENK